MFPLQQGSTVLKAVGVCNLKENPYPGQRQILKFKSARAVPNEYNAVIKRLSHRNSTVYRDGRMV
jgi:hypothetical protein